MYGVWTCRDGIPGKLHWLAIPGQLVRRDGKKGKDGDKMTLADFMQVCTGDAYISIEGYCIAQDYDYYDIPKNKLGNPDESVFSGDNPLHYVPTCLAKEPWWSAVKDRAINQINIVRGSAYPVELFIRLED